MIASTKLRVLKRVIALPPRHGVPCGCRAESGTCLARPMGASGAGPPGAGCYSGATARPQYVQASSFLRARVVGAASPRCRPRVDWCCRDEYLSSRRVQRPLTPALTGPFESIETLIGRPPRPPCRPPIPMSALTCGPASLPCDFCSPPPQVSLIITYIVPLPPASAWLEEPAGTEAA